jgi:hypothetical protein
MDSVLQLVLPFLLPYLKLLVAALLVGVFAVALIFLPYGAKVLRSLAEKIGGEKVRQRLLDAISKLESIVRLLIESSADLYRKEILEALKDGKLDDAEIKAISKKLADKAMSILTPELETFKKYLTGEAVFDYVVSVVNSMMMKWAKEIMTKQNPT